jgi:hypothetical protein
LIRVATDENGVAKVAAAARDTISVSASKCRCASCGVISGPRVTPVLCP